MQQTWASFSRLMAVPPRLGRLRPTRFTAIWIATSTTFLQIGVAWQYWLPGILILAGAGAYSRARGVRMPMLGPETSS